MVEPDDNPYAAPMASLDLVPAGERVARRGWQIGWVLVFGVNLIVPLIFGSMETQGAGWLGVAAGIVAMFFISLRWLDQYQELRSPLIVGGVCIAISQVVPLLQTMAGMLAILCREILLEGRPGPPDGGSPLVATFPAGLLVTILTGVFLLFAALASGHAVIFLKQAWKNRNR